MLAHTPLAEAKFAAHVDTVKADPARLADLIDLLREDHPVYGERGTAATVRMRGWVLLAFESTGLPDEALLFVLEELDNGRDAYLVAAAARVLRAASSPHASFAPMLIRAIENVRFHDEWVSFESYGAYAMSGDVVTSPVREALRTLRWLGPHARAVLPTLIDWQADTRTEFSAIVLEELSVTIDVIQDAAPGADADRECCAWPASLGHFTTRSPDVGTAPDEAIEFEDQDGRRVRFGECFGGRPAIVAFFYTRCNNPRKCSLTIAQLAGIQHLLTERALIDRVVTAAITYDPAFDSPERMRGYGDSRGLRIDDAHRLLRTVEGFPALRTHFGLGVNYIGSLVNRHKLELYILDASGRIAASFTRLQWDPRQVVDLVDGMLAAGTARLETLEVPGSLRRSRTSSPAILAAMSAGAAFFPKCPMCWAAYVSAFGISGVQWLRYVPWLLPMLVGLMLINLAVIWRRGRASGRMAGFWMASAGAAAILVLDRLVGIESAGVYGVALTAAGALVSAFGGWSRPWWRWRDLTLRSANTAVPVRD